MIMKFTLVDYAEKQILKKHTWREVEEWSHKKGITDPIEMCLYFYHEFFIRDNRASNNPKITGLYSPK